MERFQTLMLWISALGAVLSAGVFFAFSNFVMRALARLPAGQGIAAMNSINATVINPLFMLVFLGTGVIAAVLAVVNTASVPDTSAVKIIAAALAYLAGCIGVTMMFNVPLNNALAGTESPELWADYLKTWVMWNNVRGLAALVSGVLLLSALTT